jgi:hypothetical protein
MEDPFAENLELSSLGKVPVGNLKAMMSASGPRKNPREFRHAMAVSIAVGVLCFCAALIAAHFVGH